MKFCIKCGAKLNDDDLFCYNCGQKTNYLTANEQKPEAVEPEAVVEEKANVQPVQEEVQKEQDPFEEALIVKEAPQQETKNEPLTFKVYFKPAINKNQMNRNLLFKRAIFYTAGLLGFSIIFWFIGAFVSIHVAIRVIVFLLVLGLLVLPTIDSVLLVIYFIKNRKFEIFITVVLAICVTVLYTLVSMHFSYLFS